MAESKYDQQSRPLDMKEEVEAEQRQLEALHSTEIQEDHDEDDFQGKHETDAKDDEDHEWHVEANAS